MGYFPFFIDISEKKGVIVGGGKVAARKAEKLIPFGPYLTVIAPRIEACIRAQEARLYKDGAAQMTLQEREFQMADLEGADFVIAATDDELLNGRISAYCMAERIAVNVADDREKCSFFFPALVRKKNLTVGISTDGKSPLSAAWVREEVSRILPDRIGDIIDLMGQIRPCVMEEEAGETARKEILRALFFYCLEKDGEVTVEELMDRFTGLRGNPYE